MSSSSLAATIPRRAARRTFIPNQDFSETYVDAGTTYKELLKQFAADVQKKGAFPVIASPSARRQDSKKPGSLQAYADAAMAVAKEINVPSIDLNSLGVELNAALGADSPNNSTTRHIPPSMAAISSPNASRSVSSRTICRSRNTSWTTSAISTRNIPNHCLPILICRPTRVAVGGGVARGNAARALAPTNSPALKPC
jgi:hypothetical protein